MATESPRCVRHRGTDLLSNMFTGDVEQVEVHGETLVDVSVTRGMSAAKFLKRPSKLRYCFDLLYTSVGSSAQPQERGDSPFVVSVELLLTSVPLSPAVVVCCRCLVLGICVSWRPIRFF